VLTFALKIPEHQVLMRGEAGSDLSFHIATLGRPATGSEQQFLNPLTTKEVPESAYLEVELEFPAKQEGASPIRRKYQLKERC
jgi:hypothetical protein